MQPNQITINSGRTLANVIDDHQRWLLGEPGARADLRGANLRCANLRGVDLHGADLRGAVLVDANLVGANLVDADLRRAVLVDADLHCVVLVGADLGSAVLADADLRDADLRGADLRGAVLLDADLRGADLSNANLRGGRWISGPPHGTVGRWWILAWSPAAVQIGCTTLSPAEWLGATGDHLRACVDASAWEVDGLRAIVEVASRGDGWEPTASSGGTSSGWIVDIGHGGLSGAES